MSHWSISDIPDLQGRVAFVTGANSGLGLETTRILTLKGAHVVMACRNIGKAQKAQAEIQATIPHASTELATLDLASLASIRECANTFRASHSRLDMLFNNAGVMAIPRQETQDGFEMQFGTNYLGHFALTGLLLPTLFATPQSRVVTLTSLARFAGRVNLNDLNSEHSYSRWGAYGQSKWADLHFAFELQRRLSEAGAGTISVAAHPGYANTELQNTSASTSDVFLETFFYATLGPLAAQSAQMGTLPQLYAATAPNIHGGELVGPGGLFGMRGYPKVEKNSKRGYNKDTAVELWNESVKLTGVDYAQLTAVNTPS